MTNKYENLPVLSKVKIGDKYYWLKDADARAYLDKVASDLTNESTRAKAAEDAINAAVSAEETRAKGVEQGLDTRIQNLESRGRFLSSWNVGTGLPGDYPSIEIGKDYEYKAGDYYIVGSVPASGDKYQPDGEKITRTGESTYTVPKKAETRDVAVGDEYLFTKTGWVLIQNTTKTVNFSQIVGAARDNINLASELDKVASDASNEVDAEKALREAADTAINSAYAAADSAINTAYKAADDAINTAYKAAVQAETEARVAADNAINEAYKAADTALNNAIVNEAARASANEAELAAEIAKKADNDSLKELAFKNKADVVANVIQQTVKGVRATGDLSGTISATIGYDSTNISSTGSFTPSGDVSVTLNNNEVQSKKTDGVVPTFTEGTFTPNVPTEVDVSKFNAGAVATYEHTGFSGGSLGDATKSQFAVEGLVATVSSTNNAADPDFECLVFSAASKSDAVIAQGSFTAAVYGTDTFNGGTLPSLGDGFYKAGSAASKAADSFNGGSMPVFEKITVGVASSTFNGSAGNVTVNGNYDKAKSELTGSATINSANLAVGDIVVPAQNAAIKDAA